MKPESLRAQLLVWLIVPVAAAGVIDIFNNYRSSVETAVLIQEQLLTGSARMIGQQISYSDGAYVVQIPPAALELFGTSELHDRIYYRVNAPDGHLLSGYYEMQPPPQAVQSEESRFFDTIVRDEAVHAVAYGQQVFSGPEGPVTIEVGQTLKSRELLTRKIWTDEIREQAMMFALVATFLWFGLRRGLAPLLALRDRMLLRKPGTLEPLDMQQAPVELRPLVTAVNDYVARLDRHMSAHSRFIADASHQLRTPLSVLNTQLTYALRNDDPKLKDEALQAMRNGVQSGIRLVNQLLAFSEAEAGSGPHRSRQLLDLAQAAREVIEAHALTAGDKAIDLGFEPGQGPAYVHAAPHLLHILIGNLVDNALRYTQEGGVVTVSIDSPAEGPIVLRVEDDGPGIPVSERERVFERFYRLSGEQLDGCGLGLAIVREVADACDATVLLESPASGRGLRVSVVFPRTA